MKTESQNNQRQQVLHLMETITTTTPTVSTQTPTTITTLGQAIHLLIVTLKPMETNIIPTVKQTATTTRIRIKIRTSSRPKVGTKITIMVGAPTTTTEANLAKGSGRATHSTILTTRRLLAIIMGIIMIHQVATPSTRNTRPIARIIGTTATATTTRITITTKIPHTTILTLPTRTTRKQIPMRMICTDRSTLIMEHLATTILSRFQFQQMAVKMNKPPGIQTSIMKTHMEQVKQSLMEIHMRKTLLGSHQVVQTLRLMIIVPDKTR